MNVTRAIALPTAFQIGGEPGKLVAERPARKRTLLHWRVRKVRLQVSAAVNSSNEVVLLKSIIRVV
jgi:hypothetical protein